MTLLSACSPRFDWRDIRDEAGFTIAMPARPGSMMREINLAGQRVNMRMTATEVEGTTFAVGTVALADATAARLVLQEMQTSLVANIAGTISEEKTALLPKARADGGALPVTDLRAQGMASGQPRFFRARFVIQDTQVYQLVIIGTNDEVQRDTAEIFFSSFRLY